MLKLIFFLAYGPHIIFSKQKLMIFVYVSAFATWLNTALIW